jgi:hypothetical protein
MGHATAAAISAVIFLLSATVMIRAIVRLWR